MRRSIGKIEFPCTKMVSAGSLIDEARDLAWTRPELRAVSARLLSRCLKVTPAVALRIIDRDIEINWTGGDQG